MQAMTDRDFPKRVLILDPEATTPTERSDAARNRALVLAAAAALFAERGVRAVTMAEIAAAAGVGKGTLYRRFEDKGVLCLALMDVQLKEFQDRMLAELQEMLFDGVPFDTQLSHFLDELVAFTDAHVPLLTEAQRSGLTPGVREQPYLWQYLTVQGLLRAGIAAGQFDPELDIDYLADALLAPLNARLFRYQRERRGFSRERIAAGLGTLLRGLERP